MNVPPPDYNFSRKKELRILVQQIPVLQGVSRNAKAENPTNFEEPSVVLGGSDELDFLVDDALKR